jgi:hypothetical protein
MRASRLLLVAAIGLATFAVAGSRSAYAQNTTTGAIQGRVIDASSGNGLEDITVVVSGPALQGTQSELTDESGGYIITNLPPGTYEVVFYLGGKDKKKIRQPNVTVYIGKATPVIVKTSPNDAIEKKIHVAAPMISNDSKQGITITPDMSKKIPYAGRSFEGTMGAAAGTQGDDLGVSVSGSTSIENNYVIDGVNTGGLTYGTSTTPLLNDFIQETEVITGGYNAEFGRSTGGVVNIVTKSGSNEFHGTVFGTWSPGQLIGKQDTVHIEGSGLTATGDTDYLADFGFDIGGPIIKDKLWFYAGFATQMNETTYQRVVSTRIDRKRNNFNYNVKLDPDADNDGVPDNANYYTDASGNHVAYLDVHGRPMVDADDDPNTNAGLVRVGDRFVQCELASRCEGDNVADLDRNGLQVFEEIPQAQRELHTRGLDYQFTAKVNFAVDANNQGQVSIIGIPFSGNNIGIIGTEQAGATNIDQMSFDGSAKWNSKFNNNKTELDVVFGLHRFSTYESPLDPSLRNLPQTQVAFSDLGSVGRNADQRESDAALQFCTDGDPLIRDQFPGIVNCPVNSYTLNGPGGLTDNTEQRLSGKVSVTQRVKAAGHHQIKAGLDMEDNSLQDFSGLSGGVLYIGDMRTPYWEHYRYVTDLDQADAMDTCTTTDDANNFVRRPCTYANVDSFHRSTQTINWASFVQDSWQILPNLTINAGLRYEEQRLRTGEEIRKYEDPLTGRHIGKNALLLDGLFAPRVGLLYDWTKEGRSKIYANWGRFYESIPMDINNRAFGGEIVYDEYFDAAGQCGSVPSTGDPTTTPRLPSLPEGCPRDQSMDANFPSFGADLLSGGNPDFLLAPGLALIQPNLGAQYLDEFVFGVEYELLEDLRVGVSYQDRRLGQVIEDVSPDGGTTYIIANPGTTADVSGLKHAADRLPALDPKRIAIQNRIEVFEGIKDFDKPKRNYQALQLTAYKRFSKGLFVQGSYTYSKLEGNYPGLYSPDNGQVDPNITSQYDLVELLGNREGRLPFDRPHNIKLDGYYTFDLKQAGEITAGIRFRALSGVPTNTLGRHAVYGADESFVLPRGSGGRTDFVTSTDIRLQYTRPVGKGLKLSFFFDLQNVFDQQIETAVDEQYTADAVDPIIGGTAADLPYLKRISNDVVTKDPARKRLNFGNTAGLLAPISTRFGVRLEF